MKDVEVRYGGLNSTAIARYTLACDRKFKRENEPTADFIGCLVFGKSAEFADKFFKKGTKIAVVGRIQTGSYKNKDGNTVYTTDVIVEEQEFAESKSAAAVAHEPQKSDSGKMPDGFYPVDESITDEDLPF